MALTTPFKESEEVDLEALANNVRFYLGIAKKKNHKLGFMVGGTVGEFYNLNDEEGKAIISTVVKAADGQAVVLAATGRPSSMAPKSCVCCPGSMDRTAASSRPVPVRRRKNLRT